MSAHNLSATLHDGVCAEATGRAIVLMEGECCPSVDDAVGGAASARVGVFLVPIRTTIATAAAALKIHISRWT